MRWTRYLLTSLALVALLVAAGAVGFAVQGWQTANRDLEELRPLLEVLELIEEEYPGEVDRQELLQGAIDGMVETLDDPHSTFLDPNEMEQMHIQTRGTYGGVGIILSEIDDEVTVVEEPMPDSPAEEAGIEKDDVILSIDGRDVSELTFDRAAEAIRGEKGTEVELEVRRNDEELTFTVVRDDVQMVTVHHRIAEENPEVGYLRISLFTENTAEEVREALEELEREGMEGLLLDLRGNPGGTLHGALETAEMFLPQGEPLLYISDGEDEEAIYGEGGDWQGLPLVVLVDRGSASGAEITAGAIKDTDRGSLVGETTYGKGSVQSLYPLNRGEGIKLTTGLYLTAGGYAIDGKGIEPDYRVEMDDSRPERDEQLQEALRLLEE